MVYITGLNLVEGSVLRLTEDVSGMPVSAWMQAGFSTIRIYLIILFKLADSFAMLAVHFILKRAGLQLGEVRIRRRHGWGMKNVKSAVEKYHGTMEYEYSEHIFTVSVMLFYQ